MREKELKDYVSELCEHFPQVGEEEMLRIITESTEMLRSHVKSGFGGFRLISSGSLMGDNKVVSFLVTNVLTFGYKKFLRNKIRKKKRQLSKDDKESK